MFDSALFKGVLAVPGLFCVALAYVKFFQGKLKISLLYGFDAIGIFVSGRVIVWIFS